MGWLDKHIAPDTGCTALRVRLLVVSCGWWGDVGYFEFASRLLSQASMAQTPEDSLKRPPYLAIVVWILRGQSILLRVGEHVLAEGIGREIALPCPAGHRAAVQAAQIGCRVLGCKVPRARFAHTLLRICCWCYLWLGRLVTHIVRTRDAARTASSCSRRRNSTRRRIMAMNRRELMSVIKEVKTSSVIGVVGFFICGIL